MVNHEHLLENEGASGKLVIGSRKYRVCGGNHPFIHCSVAHLRFLLVRRLTHYFFTPETLTNLDTSISLVKPLS